MGFPRQENWSGLPFPCNLLNPGIKPVFPALAGEFFTPEPPGKPRKIWGNLFKFPEILLAAEELLTSRSFCLHYTENLSS